MTTSPLEFSASKAIGVFVNVAISFISKIKLRKNNDLMNSSS